MHLEEAAELPEGHLGCDAQGVGGGGEEGVGGEGSGAGGREIGLRVERYGGEGGVDAQAGEVAQVAQVVEGLVRVLHGDFVDESIGEVEAHHGVVELGAVTAGLERREDEKLRDALPRGEGGGVGERRFKSEDGFVSGRA